MTIAPRCSLPLDPAWVNEDEYVESLLRFVSTSTLFKNLCGGVHVLDFLTRSPDLYSAVLPADWRAWFEEVDVHDLLHVLLHARTEELSGGPNLTARDGGRLAEAPREFVEYVRMVRVHSLVRLFEPVKRRGDDSGASRREGEPVMPRHVAVGMKPKKMHEVSNFAAYVSKLASVLEPAVSEHDCREGESQGLRLVDFGSGQNYLGRTLASPPYNRHIYAIERKHHNVSGARGLDVHAKLAKKVKIMRNKKEYKRRLAGLAEVGLPTPPPEHADVEDLVSGAAPQDLALDEREGTCSARGSMSHIEHEITDGELESIIYPETEAANTKLPLMTTSLHSCGNLTHHALRSIRNPSVQAVAAIGCCYNLLTERLGPLTYKHPHLRSLHPRLVATSSAYDPHGFPMSKRLESYEWSDDGEQVNTGVRMNITARMMAVQAPGNWGFEDSEMFFTKHFYRALLQRVLFDCGLVKMIPSSDDAGDGNGSSGKDEAGTPFIIGSLRKSAFESFSAYVQAALAKLTAEGAVDQALVAEKTKHLTPEIIEDYERNYGYRRKHLAIIWSLMAYSAGVVESLIAVDRWLWLREQECVEQAWVETVFDYSLSPRNLCVVGVKKQGMGSQVS
jgi:hypothetical protein